MAGHALITVDGHRVYVAQVRETSGAADRYNLTVSGLHTYYVLAGKTPVLVHNTCPPTVADVVNRAKNLHDADGQYLYRGITNPHHQREPALEGISEPRGGHSDPMAHQNGDMNSEFTSWTPDLETAQEFAKDGENYDQDLLILRKPLSEFDPSQMSVAGRLGLEELEILVKGTVSGCEISCNSGPFGSP
jgi:hypothetical protein